MLTGCDNILDGEYKKTLETDLPEQGVRFRSVVDIMVSDRVLFNILLDELKNEELSYSKILAANAASLHGLIQSGAEEASEENGIDTILGPQEVLASVHHFKTGLLFQSPWTIPQDFESFRKKDVNYILDALYKIGMGCQIMDDMVDLASDLQRKRHNYVASLIYHEFDSNSWEQLNSHKSSYHRAKNEADLILQFPEALSAAQNEAFKYLEEGLAGLFEPEHQVFIGSVISFLSKRIGTDRFITQIKK
jgi:geranylgeranyl pyrophosphate synthase